MAPTTTTRISAPVPTGRPSRRGHRGVEHDLDAAVLLLLEDGVHVRGVLERHPVGGQVEGAERVRGVGHERHEVVDPAADVALSLADRDLLVEQGHHRHRVGHAAVDTGQRHRATTADEVDRRVHGCEPVDAGGLDRLLRELVGQQPGRALGEPGDGVAVRLHADRVDDTVRAAPVGQVDQLRHHVVVEVEHLDAVLRAEVATDLLRVDGEHAVAQVLADARGELADRAEAEHRERAALGDLGVLHGLPRGRDDVAHEEPLVVSTGVGHLDGAVVGVRHAQVLGLAAGDLAVHLRVPEERGTGAVLLHLGGLALRLEAVLAHPAVPARDVERDDDAVADLEVRDGRADLLDDAHRLVAEDVALVDVRAEDPVQVQVGAADRRGGDPHDRVGRLLDGRVGDGLDGHLLGALPGQCAHVAFLSWSLPSRPGGTTRVTSSLRARPVVRSQPRPQRAAAAVVGRASRPRRWPVGHRRSARPPMCGSSGSATL
ncbi:hypothetical protein Cus16_1377 [Curtobacterium sp. ER1/6]|nr:hypothetical protein Cus16_1377 [Curtobacterium sp. ER1/6]